MGARPDIMESLINLIKKSEMVNELKGRVIQVGNKVMQIDHPDPAIAPLGFQSVVRLWTVHPKSKRNPIRLKRSYGFRSADQAEEYVSIWKETETNSLQAIQERAEQRRLANRVPASDYYQIGDIVVNSWGYEQTNIEFYRVTEITDRTIRIARVISESVPDSLYSHGMADEVVPGRELMVGGPEYRLRVKAGGRLSQPNSYYYMHRWNGQPMYRSWYA